ncbi:MAG: NAD(P)H-dependent glycerol-3-phosphate dehydrogenase [Nocardioidaceae bacterium]
MSKVAVFGAGSWGTAFSLVLADADNQVGLWARRGEVASAINNRHENVDYLPGVALPAEVRATHDPQEALAGASVVVLAVPSQSLRRNLEQWAKAIPGDVVVMSLMKGVEIGTTMRMSEVIGEVTGIRQERLAVLTGPNLSAEIAARQPAAAVIASSSPEVAARLQAMCHTVAFRPYTNSDVVGCELAGATKNVIAIAVGMASGLGFGDNATATVITRGLAETARLGAALGADVHTFSGLAGLGDLVATCSSRLSRNRTFGEQLGQGRTVEQIAAASRQVAEGVRSCESIWDLATRHQISMPIVEHVVAVVRGEMTPAETVASLISRDPKPERG